MATERDNFRRYRKWQPKTTLREGTHDGRIEFRRQVERWKTRAETLNNIYGEQVSIVISGVDINLDRNVGFEERALHIQSLVQKCDRFLFGKGYNMGFMIDHQKHIKKTGI